MTEITMEQAAALAAKLLTATVERHERLLYGNGDVGLKGKVELHGQFIEELKDERKTASIERRRMLYGIATAIVLQLIAFGYMVAVHIGANP